MFNCYMIEDADDISTLIFVVYNDDDELVEYLPRNWRNYTSAT